VGRVRPLHDEPGDAGGNDARLAGAGSGEDQERSFRGFYRLLLGIVQVEKSESSHREPRTFMAKERTGQPIRCVPASRGAFFYLQ
jgi:hypothetical protein